MSTWQLCHFQITGQVTQHSSIQEYIWKMTKNGIKLFSFRIFTRAIYREWRRFQKASSSEMVYIMAICIISYSKISIWIFSYILHPKTKLFITSHPTSENEIGHTAASQTVDAQNPWWPEAWNQGCRVRVETGVGWRIPFWLELESVKFNWLWLRPGVTGYHPSADDDFAQTVIYPLKTLKDRKKRRMTMYW